MMFSWLFPSCISGFYSYNGTRSLHCNMQNVSAWGGLLMTLWVIFFAIQNIYIISNVGWNKTTLNIVYNNDERVLCILTKNTSSN